jgi:ABC-type Fe3+/spermidine/putrescine transport system ATPase subunit
MPSDAREASAPESSGAVSLRGLGRRYGEQWAVEPLTLDVARGEFLSLLGPSGCGKTTLLRMIAGFTPPSCGTIRINGRDVTALPPEALGIGIVVQSYAIFPSMDVFENVAFGLRVRRLPGVEITRRVEAALAQVGLDGLERRYHTELSGGQKQRVALARAIVTEPGLLLLDEPLSALDARIRAEMRAWLKELQHRLGITTIFVTHDQEEALSMSDRIAVLNKGRLEQLAPPRAIYESPESRFVAGFIGEANLLPGQVVSSGQVDAAVLGRLPVSTGELPPGSAVTLVLRPEHLRAEPAGEGPFRVVSVDYGGAQSTLRLDAGGRSLLVSAGNRPGQPPLAVGTAVTVTVQDRAATLLHDKGET